MERYHIYKLGLAILFYAIYCRRSMMVKALNSDHGRYNNTDQYYVYYQGVEGRPGVDFPIYSRIPRTTFSCKEVESGYYADLETDCQVFHICNEGVKVSFLCPNGTIFQQSDLICDWWFKVNCTNSPNLYEESAEQLRESNLRRKASRRVSNGNADNQFASRKMDLSEDFGERRSQSRGRSNYREPNSSEEAQVPQETAGFYKSNYNNIPKTKNPYPNHRQTYSEIQKPKNYYTNAPNYYSSSSSPQTFASTNKSPLNNGQPFVVSTPKFGTYPTERTTFQYSPTVPTVQRTTQVPRTTYALRNPKVLSTRREYQTTTPSAITTNSFKYPPTTRQTFTATTRKPFTPTTRQSFTSTRQPFTTTRQPFITTTRQYYTTQQDFATTRQPFITTQRFIQTTKLPPPTTVSESFTTFGSRTNPRVPKTFNNNTPLPKAYNNVVETFTNPPTVENGKSTVPRKIKSKTSYTIGLNSVQGAVSFKLPEERTTPHTYKTTSTTKPGNIKITLSSDGGFKAIKPRGKSYESNFNNINNIKAPKLSLENEIPEVPSTDRPSTGFFVTKDTFRPAEFVTSSFNAGSITGSKNTYIPTAAPGYTTTAASTPVTEYYSNTFDFAKHTDIPAGSITGSKNTYIPTVAPSFTTTSTSSPVTEYQENTFDFVKNNGLLAGSVTGSKNTYIPTAAPDFTTTPQPSPVTEYHSNTFGFVKPTGIPKPKPFSLPSSTPEPKTITTYRPQESTTPNYQTSSASPFMNVGTTQQPIEYTTPTHPTIYSSARPFTASTVSPNVFGMIDTLKEIANVRVSKDYEPESSRPGLIVPPSAGPQTLHTLAVYFANALDNLVPDENTTDVQSENETTTTEINENLVINSLLSKHTVSKYHELFKDSSAEAETEDKEVDKDEDTNGDVNDLDSEHSSNAVQSPRVRQLAKVFTQALSSYLDDPDTFKKVLHEIRPTEPPPIKTLPTETPDDDELLNFSDADIKPETPRLPTPAPPNPTWGYILAFNKSEHIDNNNLENLQSADSQSIIPSLNEILNNRINKALSPPKELPSNHWTSSPEVAKLWQTTLSVDPADINDKLETTELPKAVPDSEFKESASQEVEITSTQKPFETTYFPRAFEYTSTTVESTTKFVIEETTKRPFEDVLNGFNPNDFAPIPSKDFEAYEYEATTIQPPTVTASEALESLDKYVTESIIDYELRALPDIQLNSTQVHGILIDFMNSTKNEKESNKLKRILNKLNTTENEFLDKMQQIEKNPLTRRLILLLISECGNKTLETKAVSDIIKYGSGELGQEASHIETVAVKETENSPLGIFVQPELKRDDQDSRALQLLNSLYSIASKYGK
ncbi:PREDICTED: mucin-5AC [Nicrophorus vespilloides]|uniref:Mucin-5AC n=1 Tax=Nicrophorus vespilloides TaxID=110193 RepID=A0ABM1MQY2_NICVS|nr:PREDICTED: mucin-5AC [Nicrophorus vespilloides]XP_017776982.1 PREDICTED: mucin-5AC [Nicrophorus vespilloides]XP_017776983.1 PREDICTED: mucin-5AC [Nicrophorus vespilloides]XP_017776984.1 PREDICTED: mucin-5AC [Nicrophorus vespilloides]